jgi:transposase
MANKKCPRCGEKMDKYPALSRRDNETGICSPCGSEEALVDIIVRGSTLLQKDINFRMKLAKKKV